MPSRIHSLQLVASHIKVYEIEPDNIIIQKNHFLLTNNVAYTIYTRNNNDFIRIK